MLGNMEREHISYWLNQKYYIMQYDNYACFCQFNINSNRFNQYNYSNIHHFKHHLPNL